MRGPRRPSAWRWLNGAIFGVPLLALGSLPIVADDPESLPEVLYHGLLAAAAACFVLCAYRAYRDYCRGDLELDVAKWAGAFRPASVRHEEDGTTRLEPLVADDSSNPSRDEISTTPAILSPDSKWADQISKELDELFAEDAANEVRIPGS